MGMLFNTQRTKDLLAMVNTVFDERGLVQIRTNQAQWAAAFNYLGTVVNGRSYKTYDVARSLGIDFDIVTAGAAAGTSPDSLNWQSWCKHIDTNLDVSTGHNAAQVLGNLISTAITTPAVVAIEFFAVPGQNISISHYPSPENGKVTLVITITTLTIQSISLSNNSVIDIDVTVVDSGDDQI